MKFHVGLLTINVLWCLGENETRKKQWEVQKFFGQGETLTSLIMF